MLGFIKGLMINGWMLFKYLVFRYSIASNRTPQVPGEVTSLIVSSDTKPWLMRQRWYLLFTKFKLCLKYFIVRAQADIHTWHSTKGLEQGVEWGHPARTECCRTTETKHNVSLVEHSHLFHRFDWIKIKILNSNLV